MKECTKCEGNGHLIIHGYEYTCRDCKGSGEMAVWEDGGFVHCGIKYRLGQRISYINTRGNLTETTLCGFKGKWTKLNVGDCIPLKDIYFTFPLKNGKWDSRPLYRSMTNLPDFKEYDYKFEMTKKRGQL